MSANKILIHVLAVTVALMTLIPFVWMVSASFMQQGEANQFPPRLIPESFSLEHYLRLFISMNIVRYFLNSLILSASITGLSLLVNSMAGFAFAKFHFPGKESLFKLLLAAMIIPAQVTMLPLFLMMNQLGLINSYLGVIIPGMASIFGIFLIRQYISSLPDSLIEAARLDGASDFQIYWKIVLPLAKPILVTLGLFTFMGTWNDFMWPLIIMTRENMYTLPVAMANLSGEHAQDTELMMAGAVITVLPVIIVFLALQRFYIEGIMLGSVKE
ncbi:MAG: carbohydrate ABC transporter permease [Candidatus Marinimicrobia bacterium]|nr:carbohydrate ABC transporter permease [Candidatus Neomarinimicrobiota bacterium]MBL7123216.1 carbohydrate ABC transporter permease [Candidatus Neomarinimicrobiota bacterium]